MPRCRQTAWVCQSNANPAEGGSKAIGSAAILVQTSHNASGSGSCVVLNRSTMSCQPREDRCAIAQETQSKQAGMFEQPFDDPDKRAEQKVVVRRKRWC